MEEDRRRAEEEEAAHHRRMEEMKARAEYDLMLEQVRGITAARHSSSL